MQIILSCLAVLFAIDILVTVFSVNKITRGTREYVNNVLEDALSDATDNAHREHKRIWDSIGKVASNINNSNQLSNSNFSKYGDRINSLEKFFGIKFVNETITTKNIGYEKAPKTKK